MGAVIVLGLEEDIENLWLVYLKFDGSLNDATSLEGAFILRRIAMEGSFGDFHEVARSLGSVLPEGRGAGL